MWSWACRQRALCFLRHVIRRPSRLSFLLPGQQEVRQEEAKKRAKDKAARERKRASEIDALRVRYKTTICDVCGDRPVLSSSPPPPPSYPCHQVRMRKTIVGAMRGHSRSTRHGPQVNVDTPL